MLAVARQCSSSCAVLGVFLSCWSGVALSATRVQAYVTRGEIRAFFANAALASTPRAG